MDGAMISQVKQDEPTIKTGGIKSSYLHADTCSTNDFMVNPAYLTWVQSVEEPPHIHTKVG